MKATILLLSLALFATTFKAKAQESTIPTVKVTGTVTDSKGEALIGVGVRVQGINKGTITDIEGNFNLSVPEDGKLLFSYVGYKAQVVEIGNRSTINVTLEEDETRLEEVVVVGYGSQSRRDLTTAVSSVSSKEISKMPVPSIDQAIQGRAAGVQVTKGTGAPGGAVSIRIRGTASINGGQEPLYVIDGVPINNSFTGSPQAGNDVINGMAGINPEDIASVEILKDAAAASIYGARAANGVVLITTKRGQVGKPKVTLNTYAGISHLSRRYDLLNADQFVSKVNEGLIKTNQPPIYRDAPIYDTNWQDEIFQTAPMTSTNLSIQGGNENTQYMITGNYFNQEGILVNSKFDRFSMRTNLDHKINERVNIGSSLMISRATNNRLRNTGGPNVQDTFNQNADFGPSALSSALTMNPTIPVRNADGTYGFDSLNAIGNPVALANEADLTNHTLRIIGNVFAEFQLAEGLVFRTSWGADIREEREEFFFPEIPMVPGGGRIQNRNFSEILWLTENYLSYNFNLAEKHNFTALAGVSFQESSNRGSFVEIGGVGGEIRTLSGGTVVRTVQSVGFVDWGMSSYFTRFNYDYEGKYLASATLRADGSSRFGPNNRFGFFPSASFGWRISGEPFLQNSSVVDDLKLRVSYGITGNDQIPPFGWRGAVTRLSTNYIGEPGDVPISITNEDYSWESTAQFNLGVDFTTLNGRLTFTGEIYDKQTSDLLLFVDIPFTTGFTQALGNVGAMQNRGFEFMVDYDIVRKRDFNWNSQFNISYNFNKITELVDGTDVVTGPNGFANIARVGEPISFQALRVEDQVNPQTGDWMVRDVSGPDGEPDGRIGLDDLELIGSPLPLHFGGFTNNFSYKNWDASIFFQWSYGNMIYNSTRSFIENVGRSSIARIGTNLSAEALDRWVQPGDEATFRGVDYNNTYTAAAGFPLDRYIEDGSYLRLKNLSIGYTLNSGLVERYGVENARIYATANNLITLTNYSGYDPEVNHDVTTNVGVGSDNGTYPQSRIFILGVNLTF